MSWNRDKCRNGTKFATKTYSATRTLPSRRLILHLPCLSSRLMKGGPSTSKPKIWPPGRNASMVNSLMFVSEIPNKPKAFGLAATKRWSPFMTTIASGKLANNFRKSFSLSRSTSFSLRGFSATLLPSLVSVFCARWSCTAICSNAIINPDLNLAICITRCPSSRGDHSVQTVFRAGRYVEHVRNQTKTGQSEEYGCNEGQHPRAPTESSGTRSGEKRGRRNCPA